MLRGIRFVGVGRHAAHVWKARQQLISQEKSNGIHVLGQKGVDAKVYRQSMQMAFFSSDSFDKHDANDAPSDLSTTDVHKGAQETSEPIDAEEPEHQEYDLQEMEADDNDIYEDEDTPNAMKSSRQHMTDAQAINKSRFSRTVLRLGKRSTPSRPGRSPRAQDAKRVADELRLSPEEEIDYEHFLSAPRSQDAKRRMYEQLLNRDRDRDKVCHNCGEPGHISPNCTLPLICSHCGGLGHRSTDCYHAKKESKRTKQDQASSYKAERHERFRQAFDDEINEYLEAAERRKQKKK